MGLRKAFKKIEKATIRTGRSHAKAEAREQEERYRQQLEAERAAQAAKIEAEKIAAVEREKEKERKLREEYPRPSFLPNDGIPTIAVVGETGVGKSSLINALMGKYVAKTGCFETTELPPQMFEKEMNGGKVRIADMPGGGTEKYTSETYFRDSGMRHFTSVAVVAAGKPRELTLQAIRHLEENNVPVTLAVNKMDEVIDGCASDGQTEDYAFSETVASYKKALEAVGSNCPVFPVSAVHVQLEQRGSRRPAEVIATGMHSVTDWK